MTLEHVSVLMVTSRTHVSVWMVMLVLTALWTLIPVIQINVRMVEHVPTLPSPCLNAPVLKDTYSGSTCDIDLTPCDPHPCGDGGNCTDLGQGMYSCECSQTYFLDTTINSCVDQCPLFTFENHSSGQCQPCKIRSIGAKSRVDKGGRMLN